MYVDYTIITSLAAVWETSTVCHLNATVSSATYVTVKIVIVGLQDFPDCQLNEFLLIPAHTVAQHQSNSWLAFSIIYINHLFSTLDSY